MGAARLASLRLPGFRLVYKRRSLSGTTFAFLRGSVVSYVYIIGGVAGLLTVLYPYFEDYC